MILVTACFRREIQWVEPRAGVRTVRTAMGDRAAEDLERLVPGGETITGLLSTGFCAGLDARLRTGDLFVAETIRHRGETIRVCSSLVERALAALDGADLRVWSGACETAAEVLDVDDKRRLGAQGGMAADMESGSIARWAEAREIPFLVCRLVLDPAEWTVPFSNSRPLWASVLRHPLAAMDLAGRSKQAGRRLGRGIGILIDAFEEER
jgi:nucleoside phosphorylase